MSNDDDQNDDEVPEDQPRGLRKQLEEANRRAAEAESRAKQYESREVFRDAGLDFSNKQHQAFAKAYDGPFEADAVKAYVTDLGIGQQAPPPEAPIADPDEQAAMIRIAEAARDGAPTPQPDRREQLRKDLEEAVKRKATTQEIAAIGREFSRAGGNAVIEDYQ